MNGIPTILKDLRKNRNLTQFQLSQALKIGQATIAGYENGSREPHINSLIAYANFLNAPLIIFLAGRTTSEISRFKQKSPPCYRRTSKNCLTFIGNSIPSTKCAFLLMLIFAWKSKTSQLLPIEKNNISRINSWKQN